MKVVCTALLLTLVLFVPAVMSARHIARPHSHHGNHHPTLPSIGEGEKARPNVYGEKRPLMNHRRPNPLQIAGSTLPNCSHACGSCSPCQLVMESFVCASLAEVETCPMAYKCMCNNRSYPVP